MKFGKTFLSQQIPEWSVFYMNYKLLKKIIKLIHASDVEDIEPTITTFFFELDRDIEKVDEYYNSKYHEYSRRLERLVHVLGYQEDSDKLVIDSNYELDEIINILLELRSVFRNLKWYGELNHKGFTKILKKLDKNLIYLNKQHPEYDLSTTNKQDYLLTRVNPLPFAHETELLTSLDTISTILHKMVRDDEDDEIRRVESTEDEATNIDPTRFHSMIAADDSIRLSQSLAIKQSFKSLLSFFVRSTLANATKCIDVLFLKLIETVQNDSVPNPLFDQADISGRNFFHQLVVNLGKKQLIKEQVTPGESNDVTRFIGNKGPDGGDESELTLAGLTYILVKINDTELKSILIAKDNYARTPLHYSAQYGLKDVSKLILKYLALWNLIPSNTSIDSIEFWGDRENLTPLHLAIIGNHPKTTTNLLLANNKIHLTCHALLLLAVRLDSLPILNSIINYGHIDIDYTNAEYNMETALYIACKLNYYNLVAFLLENDANTELGELIFGWTPIFVAASEGFTQVVKILIEYDAKFDIVDDSGWFPMEHACLRGNLDVADLLEPKDKSVLLYDAYHHENNKPRISTKKSETSPTELTPEESLTPISSSTDFLPEIQSPLRPGTPDSQAGSNHEVYKQLKMTGSSQSIPRPISPQSRMRLKKQIRPIKSFGHRYLNQGESLILITMGTTDLRDLSKSVDLSKVSLSKTFTNELDTALTLSVSCIDKTTKQPVEPPVLLDLPLEDHHGSATDPLTFKLTNLDPDDVIINFDLIPTYGYSKRKHKKILGRAIALLKDAYTKVGPNLRSLNNNITIPIMDSTSLDILGTLKFEYMCVTAFEHSSMSIERSDTYWKQLVSTRVIGHRGLGKNDGGRKSLQLGENTVESFIAAASLGASYVEFDVQLTKDYIPVVYHDFTVAESGVDIPMHAMTAEQFLGLNDQHQKKKERQAQKTYATDDQVVKDDYGRSRSLTAFPSAPNFHNGHRKFSSLLLSTKEKQPPIDEQDKKLESELRTQFNSRMKLTKTWKDKGFKGNARGLSVSSNFVTLGELFKKLPKSVGFNIELKYPMLDEAETEAMGEIAIDLNFYVDTILKAVYDENSTQRDIIFLSFHPDVCLLLSLKQPTIPILFLTESGTAFMADIRALSLQNAIRFAKKWNLLGVVSAAAAIVKTPRLAQVVKSLGLVCVTYGVENNDPELAKIQMKAGVDAVIADSVLAVREGLRQDQESLKILEDSLAV